MFLSIRFCGWRGLFLSSKEVLCLKIYLEFRIGLDFFNDRLARVAAAGSGGDGRLQN